MILNVKNKENFNSRTMMMNAKLFMLKKKLQLIQKKIQKRVLF